MVVDRREAWMIEWVILGVQVLLGVFFAISGFHKVFVPARHETLVRTLVEDKVPFVRFNEWAVPITELVAGALLAVNLLPFWSAGALFVVMVGACLFDAPARVREMKPLNAADCLSCWLYLCETWLLAALLLVMAANAEDVLWMMQLL